MSEDEQHQIFLDLLEQHKKLFTEFAAVRAKKKVWVESIFKIAEALQSKRGRITVKEGTLCVDQKRVEWPSSSDLTSLWNEEAALRERLTDVSGRVKEFQWGQYIELPTPYDDHPYRYNPTIMT